MNLPFPGEKGAAIQSSSIRVRNQVITRPEGAFMVNHLQNVLAVFPAPARQILFRDIGDEIDHAAHATAFAIHVNPFIKKDSNFKERQEHEGCCHQRRCHGSGSLRNPPPRFPAFGEVNRP